MWTSNANKLSLYMDSLVLVKWGIDLLTSEEKDRGQLLLKKPGSVKIPCQFVLENGQKISSMEIEFFMIHPRVCEKLTFYKSIINPKNEYYDYQAMVFGILSDVSEFLFYTHFKQSEYFSEKISSSYNTHSHTRETHYKVDKTLSSVQDAFFKFSESINLEKMKDASLNDYSSDIGTSKDFELLKDLNFNPIEFVHRFHARNQNYPINTLYVGLEILNFITARMKELEQDFGKVDKDAPSIKGFTYISEKELWERRNKSAKYII